jgi:hypothetical protein
MLPLMLFLFFIKQIISPVYIYAASFFFITLFLLFVSYILIYLFYEKRKEIKTKILNEIYSNIISEAVLCSPEELKIFFQQPNVQVIKHKWFQKKFARKYFIKGIFKTNESLSGSAIENLRELYIYFELQKDSYKNLRSAKWYKKAKAFQQLAEMKQEQYYKNIYKDTFNSNKYVREAAQIAIVKVAGFPGLRFLDILRFKVTHWQQLLLLDQLGNQPSLKTDKINKWLTSQNDSVVEFALKLVEVYKFYELEEACLKCWSHQNAVIRLQLLETLCAIGSETTADKLCDIYDTATIEEKICILKTLYYIAGKQHISFLTSLLKNKNEQILYYSLRAIENIDADYSKIVLKDVHSNPSFSFILLSLQPIVE